MNISKLLQIGMMNFYQVIVRMKKFVIGKLIRFLFSALNMLLRLGRQAMTVLGENLLMLFLMLKMIEGT